MFTNSEIKSQRQVADRLGQPASTFLSKTESPTQDSLIDKNQVITSLSNLFLELLAKEKALLSSINPLKELREVIFEAFSGFYANTCNDVKSF